MTIALYPDIVTNEDLTPDHFGTEIDEACQEMTDATKGWGSDKNKSMQILAKMDTVERTKFAIRYKELNEGKALSTLMQKEFSGDFGIAMELLAMPPHEAECAMLRKTCKGIGVKSVPVIYSILCGRTNNEIDLLKRTFYRLYDKDLGKLLASELHGDMERIVFNCLQASEEVYDPQFHTADKAMEDAELIHSKGQGKRWGTDEKGIFKVLCAAPPKHLDAINQAYADKYGYTLLKGLEKELGGMLEKNVRDATLHLIGMKLKPYETMAKVYKKATDGLGTDELLLTCTTIRYQPVLATGVMAAHMEMSGKTVHDRIRSETSGMYKQCLIEICNVAWPEEG